MILSDAVHLFLDARRHMVAKQTLRNNEIYLRALTEGLGACEIKTIQIVQLRTWRSSLFARNLKYADGRNTLRKPEPGKLSVYTVRGMVETCRQLFNWLVTEGYLEQSPAKRLEVPALPDGPPRAMAVADLDKLIAAARASPTASRSTRNVAILLFLRDTGCRIGGIGSIRFEHLDVERRTALVREKGRGGGKTRAVFFKAETGTALQAWFDEHPLQGKRKAVKKYHKPVPSCALEFVFVGERYPYAPLTARAVYDIFTVLKRKAGVTGRTNPHGTRHLRAKTLLLNGAPLGLVSRILGHSDIRVTDKAYGIYASQELKEGYDRWA